MRVVGEIVGAGFVSHLPTIVLPEAERRALNDGHEISLVPGLRRLRTEALDRLRPDTVVVFDTHWFTTVEFVVTAHDHRAGRFTSEELPRGMAQMPYDFRGDRELAEALAARAEGREDMWIHASDDPYLPIHYPTTNLLPFLQGDARWVSISVCQTAAPSDFLLVGTLLAEAIRQVDRRVVLLASGGMSHRFWPLQELRRHEASDPVHIITAEAREADQAILARWVEGDHAAVLDGMDTYRAYAPEGRFGHYLMMVGALGGRSCHAAGVPYSDYESGAGTGQVHVWFDQPAAGWTEGGTG